MTEPDSPIKRILVALDSSVPASGGLDVASDLAYRLRAELQGLFVEDDELFRLAALPFTTQVNLSTGGRLPLETTELETQMAGLAAEAQRRLAAIAARNRIRWSFRTVRGRIAHEVATAAESVDLVIVEGGNRRAPAHARLGLPASATVKTVTRSVLILRAGRRFEGPLHVVFDGTPQSEKALRMAAMLSQEDSPLTVLISGKEDKDRMALESRVRTIIGPAADRARLETYDADTLNGLCAHVGTGDAGLVVVAADNPMLAKSDVANLLDSINCTVLLVR